MAAHEVKLLYDDRFESASRGVGDHGIYALTELANVAGNVFPQLATARICNWAIQHDPRRQAGDNPANTAFQRVVRAGLIQPINPQDSATDAQGGKASMVGTSHRSTSSTRMMMGLPSLRRYITEGMTPSERRFAREVAIRELLVCQREAGIGLDIEIR